MMDVNYGSFAGGVAEYGYTGPYSGAPEAFSLTAHGIPESNSIMEGNQFATTGPVYFDIAGGDTAIADPDWRYINDNQLWLTDIRDIPQFNALAIGSVMYTITYRVADSGATGTFTRTVDVTEADVTPTVPQGTWTIGTITKDQTTASLTPTYNRSDATSYEYSINSGAWTTFTGTISLSGLDADTTYAGFVRAVNAEGNGPETAFSFTTAQVATSAPTGKPVFGAPTITQTTASISVTYAEDDADSLEYSVDSGAWTTFTSTVSLSGLTPGETYNVSVRAVNAVGSGPVASTTFATDEVPDAGAPQGTWTIGVITKDQTTASFTPVYSDTDATSYEYTLNGVDWTTFTGTITLTGLTADTPHTGSVRAVNAQGNGAAAEFSFTTNAAPLEVPAGTITFGTTTASTSTVSLPTSYDGADATSFEYRVDDGPWITYTSPITISGLTAEKTYAIDASAVNGDGRGTIFSTTVTTIAGSAMPLERTYTLTAGIDQLPKPQQFTIYQGERVRFNITHDIDMTGRVMIMRIAPALGSPSKLSMNAANDSFLMTSEMSESLETANKFWQILVKEGDQRVVVAVGTSLVKRRIKEPK